MRQIILDTETTGLEVSEGHRVIEIGAVELVERRLTGRHFHYYLNPEREVDRGALEVHGISNEFLRDKPRFSEVMDEFLDFVRDSELIIHNAAFDLGFLDAELNRAGCEPGRLKDHCSAVLDTLLLARKMHPGQSNSLDALCRRYEIDNSNRTLHGALLDSEILAEVYLAMTGGQETLSLSVSENRAGPRRRDQRPRRPSPVLMADSSELDAHAERLQAIGKSCGGEALWQQLLAPAEAESVASE